MNEILEIKGISKTFDSVEALTGIDLKVNEGVVLGIAGESGSGKTTLARLMLKLISPASGSIYYRGKDIGAMTTAEELMFRKEVQVVFQNPYTSLDPRMKINEILSEPLDIHYKLKKEEKLSRVSDLLNAVELDRMFINKYPHELSGGERQRVGIARALALSPKMMVLDEPVSSLDVSIQAQILNLLVRLKKERSLTYVFISHDLSVIRYLCDRVAVLEKGRIVEYGGCEEVFSRPRSDYTRRLIDSVPRLFKQVAGA